MVVLLGFSFHLASCVKFLLANPDFIGEFVIKLGWRIPVLPPMVVMHNTLTEILGGTQTGGRGNPRASSLYKTLITTVTLLDKSNFCSLSAFSML